MTAGQPRPASPLAQTVRAVMWRCLVVVAMLWIGGCASLPVDYERTVSHALQDTGDTRLARSGRAALQAHAGQNAFRPLPDGVDAKAVYAAKPSLKN